jgi:hypothetical protein
VEKPPSIRDFGLSGVSLVLSFQIIFPIPLLIPVIVSVGVMYLLTLWEHRTLEYPFLQAQTLGWIQRLP